VTGAVANLSTILFSELKNACKRVPGSVLNTMRLHWSDRLNRQYKQIALPTYFDAKTEKTRLYRNTSDTASLELSLLLHNYFLPVFGFVSGL